ncbi:MAG: hypothetical protein HYY06_25125 [Deltaproteobacteria bacterium]|nr:hypothetical protein [Deltaproteobacteria bacterium]
MRTGLAVAALLPALALADDATPAAPIEARRVPVEDPGGHALDRFSAALRRVAAGEERAIARVAVLGDSHIAADLFTGALRRRLQARLGDAGHGFVLLGSAWPLYRHLDVEHGATASFATRRLRPRDHEPFRFGLGGGVSTATQGAVAWVGTAARGPVGRRVSRFEVFYETEPGGGALELRLDGQRVATLETSSPSHQAAYRVVEAPDGRHRLEIESMGPGPTAVYGAVLERSGPGVVVDSLGVPALAALHLSSSDPTLLAEHLCRRAHDLVVFAFGTNDVRWEAMDLSTYRASLARLLTRIRTGAPRASCLVLGPIDRRYRSTDGVWNASLDEVIERQRGAAVDAGCAFWDQRAAMGGPGSMARWMVPRPRFTLRDGVHLSGRGYDVLAGALASELLAPIDSP